MKKFLPILCLIVLLVVPFFAQPALTYAQGVAVPTPDVAYSPDAEVNFVGKAAARSIQFLNWTLTNYHWQCFEFNDAGICNNTNSPLISFWATIRNIVYALFALFVLITAFIMITTRGRSLSVQRFLPRFIAVVLLVTFSYALLQLLYVTTDAIQGFFLTKPPDAAGKRELISAVDLLYVGWDYETFIGLRKIHPFFDESVFINLLLARMTAVTYYAMTGILLIRKIILWFFIVVSPIFPILLLYYPVRNTAKIWIGEFFRWTMYAPLFSVFLAGLVAMWKTGIPLLFRWDMRDEVGRIVYPTATNILLGGPGQEVSITNNLNVPDTFAQYVVALIMLWVVILLPFVLLQIFLDYLNSFSFSESPAIQKIINSSYSLLNRQPPSLPPGGQPSGPSGSTGLAKQLPFAKFDVAKVIPQVTGEAKQLPMAMPLGRAAQAQINAQILNATNLAVPTIRDIAKYEKDIMSQSTNISKTYGTLQQIANPQSITNSVDRERFMQIRDQLVQQSQQGNTIANAVISAVNTVNNVSSVRSSNQNIKNLKNSMTKIANPAIVTSTVQKEQMTQLHDSLVKESQQGNNLASTILSATKETTATQVQNIREQLIKESLNNNHMATNVLATSMTKIETTKLSQVIKDIATNSTQTSSVDKEKIQQMHESLVKESEKGNTLATEILNSKEITSTAQVEQLKERLIDASLKGNQVASQILSTAVVQHDTEVMQQVLQQISNPESITNTVDKERFVKLKEKLTAAQQQGNEVAKEVLAASDKKQEQAAVSKETKTTETKDVQSLKAKLLEAKAKGDPIASELLGLIAGQAGTPVTAELPQSNRVQAVSVEDYEAVKDMWKDNYTNLDVPDGVTDRKEWVETDVNDIEGIINLLSSQDPQLVQEGMQQVSNVLPFLMLGGFSKDEIVSYLKAKQEAASTVLQTITQEEAEEDTLVTVEKKHKTAVKTQAATIANPTDDDDAESDLTTLSSTPSQSIVNPLEQNEVVRLTKVRPPTVRDLVGLEMALKHNKEKEKLETKDLRERLESLAQTNTTDAEKATLLQALQDKREKGDPVASAIMTAAKYVGGVDRAADNQAAVEEFKKLVAEFITISSLDRNRSQLETIATDLLSRENQRGAQLAQNILGINSTFINTDVERIKESLVQKSEEANELALAIITVILADASYKPLKDFVSLLDNPASAQPPVDREKIQNLHDTLTKEQASNQLIQSLLSVKSQESTEKINEVTTQMLEQAKQGNTLAATIFSVALLCTDLETVHRVLNKIVHPYSDKTNIDEKKLALYRDIVKSKEEGSELAASLLVINQETSDAEIKRMFEQVVAERSKDNQLARSIVSLLPVSDNQSVTAIFPEKNVVQTVSLEDYEAVKQMWADNYEKTELPDGETDRVAWLQKEMSSLNTIINLISSTDEAQQKEGIQQVSYILPFFLLGGFSLEEIKAYLKAKLQAASSALASQQKERETLLDAQAPAAHRQEAAMVMQVPSEAPNTPVQGNSTQK